MILGKLARVGQGSVMIRKKGGVIRPSFSIITFSSIN